MLANLCVPYFAFFGIGSSEILVIGVVALLLFGKRLPEVMRSMGKGVSEFKKGLKDMEREVQEADEAPARPAASAKTSQTSQTQPQLPPPPPPPPPGP